MNGLLVIVGVRDYALMPMVGGHRCGGVGRCVTPAFRRASVGANPWRVIGDIKDQLRLHAAAVQIPMGLEDKLEVHARTRAGVCVEAPTVASLISQLFRRHARACVGC